MKINATTRLKATEVKASLPKNWRKMDISSIKPKKAKLKIDFKVDKYHEVIPAGTQVTYRFSYSSLLGKNICYISGPAVNKAGYKNGISLGDKPEKYIDIQL